VGRTIGVGAGGRCAAGPCHSRAGIQPPGSVGGPSQWFVVIANVLFVLAFATVGALVASRVPGNPVGWLLLGSALVYTLAGLGTGLPAPRASAPAGFVAAADLAGQPLYSAGLALGFLTLLLFPTGSLPSRGWRWAGWLIGAGWLLFTIGQTFGPATLPSNAANPLAVGGSAGRLLNALQTGQALAVAGGILAGVSLIVRFRRAEGVMRKQIEWLAYAAAIVVAGIIANAASWRRRRPRASTTARTASSRSSWRASPSRWAPRSSPGASTTSTSSSTRRSSTCRWPPSSPRSTSRWWSASARPSVSRTPWPATPPTRRHKRRSTGSPTSGFPVENLDIVGSGLRLVERVTGRLTNARAAAAGAASGAWFGLFIGLLVGLFTRGPAWIGLIIGGLLIGAAWGAVFGLVGHAATRGRRDFSSARTLTATRYDIVARGGTAEQARSVLQQAGLLSDQHADVPPPGAAGANP